MTFELPPTLGPVVCDWMERNLVHGPGDVEGKPYRLTDEQRAFVWRSYELREDGRRRYRRAVYSRRKGVAKTELAAALACAELLGPVRFAGWDDDGQPLGRPVDSPDIPCVATAEDQADLVYGAARVMLTEGPLADYVDAGLERTLLRDRPGRLYLVTSKSQTREGARPTFTPCDETHLWTTSDLKRLHATLRRNLAKRAASDAWMLETTTAYAPGEQSVAEESHDYGKRVRSGEITDATLLFDHLEASARHDLGTEDGLRAAIEEASGLALAFTNVDAILDEFRDPQTDPADARRYWLNQVVASTDQWLAPAAWQACARPEVAVAKQGTKAAQPVEVRGVFAWNAPRSGDKIALGFDGSAYEDATALIGCRLEDGHLFTLGIWEKPEGETRWEVPRAEVDAVVHRAMADYDVVRFYVDPPYWQAELDRWSSEWGAIVVAFWTNHDVRMAHALERLHTAVLAADMTHDGNPVLARHVANARTRSVRAGTLIRKSHRKSPNKIDAAVAAVLAYEARADAVAAGATKQSNDFAFFS